MSAVAPNVPRPIPDGLLRDGDFLAGIDPQDLVYFLLNVGDGDLHDSFGKIGQAFVKLKYQDKAQLKLGRQLYDSLLLISSTSRAVPNTYSGASGELTATPEFRIYGAMFDQWSRRAQSNFEEFATDRSGEGDIDYVSVVGASYAKGPYEFDLEHLVSKDYLRKLGLVGSYTFELAEKQKLKLTAGVHTSRDAGELFVTSSESAELDDEDVPGARSGVTRSDNDGRGYYLDAEWTRGNLALGAALASSTAPGSRTTSPATTA